MHLYGQFVILGANVMDEIRADFTEKIGLSERQKVLYSFNNTESRYPAKPIHVLIEEQVICTPDTIAVRFKEETLTYLELNEKSDKLAGRLRENGVKPDTVVGVMVERSLDMLVGILGILKSGGAYLPIDPQFPKSRIEYMLEDSDVSILLTHTHLEASISFKGKKMYLDDSRVFEKEGMNLVNINSPSDLMYVIYTSGSTGKPKGVMLEHRNFANFIAGVTERIDFSQGKTIVSLTTISFDIFTLETLLPLTRGLTIVIADPMSFGEYVKGRQIDMLQTTPSTMNLILKDSENIRYICGLGEIMIGGESFPQKLLRDIKKLTSAKIYNMYGPTETTVWSTIKELTQADEITVGTPISNTQIYILDQDGDPQPIDKPGELFIGGDGVARGYINKPELTSSRFLENTFRNGERIYRTGDMAKWADNGEVVFLGRIDQQVKIRGFRIELGEIENCLSKLDGIKDCFVSTKKNKWGEDYLVAYYLSDSELTVSELIAHLAEKLPEYMIPGFYVKLDKMPLLPNCKLDRNALPEPDNKRPLLHSKYAAPRTEPENKLVEIWSNILNRNLVGVDDNFFELGGNSILLSMMYKETDTLYPGTLEIADIFAYPTISRLAGYISQKKEKSQPPKRIMHPTIMPSEYYNTDVANSTRAELSYFLTGEELEVLFLYLSRTGYGFRELSLALYMYLLHEISGQECITVRVLTGKCGAEVYIDMDFNSIKDMEGIIDLISMPLDDESESTNYESVARDYTGDSKKIIPVFHYSTAGYYANSNAMDLVLSVYSKKSETEIRFEYDTGRFCKERIKGFFKEYLRLIKAVTHIK